MPLQYTSLQHVESVSPSYCLATAVSQLSPCFMYLATMTNCKQHLGSGILGSLPKINHLLFELDLEPILTTSYTESVNSPSLFEDYTGNEVQDYNVELLLRRCTCLSSVSCCSAKGTKNWKISRTQILFRDLWVEINTACFSQKVRDEEGMSKRVQADEVSSVLPTAGRSSAVVNAAEV